MAPEPAQPSTQPPVQAAAKAAPALPAIVGRIGLWCTFITALILIAVIAANVAVLGLHIPPNRALAVLLQIGPTLGLLLSTVATYINYYGTWRIVRGKDEYDVGADLKSHAADLPSALQNQPGALSRLAGCTTFLPAAALAVSLVASGLTLAPPPFRVLGVGVSGGGYAPAGLGVSAGQTPAPAARGTTTPTATTTATPTQTPHAQPTSKVTVSPASYSGDCGHGTLPAQKITLDNSGGTVAATWKVSIRETLPGTTEPWSKPNTSGGTIPAGQIDSFQLTPNGSLCRSVPPAGASFHADVAVTGGTTQTYTVTATISGSGH
jgi:hypothetical protein